MESYYGLFIVTSSQKRYKLNERILFRPNTPPSTYTLYTKYMKRTKSRIRILEMNMKKITHTQTTKCKLFFNIIVIVLYGLPIHRISDPNTNTHPPPHVNMIL